MGDSANSECSLLPIPWRKQKEKNPWTEEVYKNLKEEIVTHELLKKANIEYFNVLLVGQVSAGKSSFFNTVETVFSDHVTMKANAGSVQKSLTTQYRTYKVRAKDHKNKAIKFKFCDSMGLEGGDAGLMPNAVAQIMDGHVKDMAELSSGGISPKSSGYNSSPGVGDQIHCVAFVVDSSKVDYLDEKLIVKLASIREEANKRNLNPMVILTRIDQLCDETAKDVTNVYNSTAIKEVVQNVSKKFGITENLIYPIQNYSSETEKELGIDILTLRTLRQILRCSQDFLEDRVDRDKETLRQARRSTSEIKKRYKGKLSREETVDEPDDSNNSDDSKGTDEEYSTCPSEDEDFNSNDEQDPHFQRKKSGYQNTPPPPPPPQSSTMEGNEARHGVALYDYKAKNSGQVSIKKGNKVQELNPDVGGWTKVQVKNGKKGNIPTNYINWEIRGKIKIMKPFTKF